MAIRESKTTTGSWLTPLAVAASLFLGPAEAEAKGRVALVIGNSAYRNVSALPNPTRDAQAVKDVLGEARFDVVHVLDATSKDLRDTLDAFATKAADADEALVYFAGHAVQMRGANHLLPVDLAVAEEADIARQSLSLDDILKRLDATRAKAKIVILDACRDNPFVKSQGARGLAVALTDAAGEAAERGLGSEAGLARVASKGGTFVAFSTSPGATAADGSGDHSPYTAAFLKFVREPGLPVEQLFRQVRSTVDETTRGTQLPWETSSLTTPFLFFGSAETRADGQGTAVVRASTGLRPTEATLRDAGSAEAYRTAILWDDPVIYRQVLAIYPDDPNGLRLHRILALRLEEAAWARLARSGTAEDLRLFLSLYPASVHAPEAQAMATNAAGRQTQRVAALCPMPKRAVLPVQPPAMPKTKRAELVKPVPPAPKPVSRAAAAAGRDMRPPVVAAPPVRRAPSRLIEVDDEEDDVAVSPRRPILLRPLTRDVEPDFPRPDRGGRDWPRSRPTSGDGGLGAGMPFPRGQFGDRAPSMREGGSFGRGATGGGFGRIR